MPVSACMEVFTKKRVAMWDMGNRDYREVTEAEWAAWFGKAYEEEPLDLDVAQEAIDGVNKVRYEHFGCRLSHRKDVG